MGNEEFSTAATAVCFDILNDLSNSATEKSEILSIYLV